MLDVKDYGATVRLTRTREALLHVSELTHHTGLSKRPVRELLAPGQRVQVQVYDARCEYVPIGSNMLH